MIQALLIDAMMSSHLESSLIYQVTSCCSWNINIYISTLNNHPVKCSVFYNFLNVQVLKITILTAKSQLYIVSLSLRGEMNRYKLFYINRSWPWPKLFQMERRSEREWILYKFDIKHYTYKPYSIVHPFRVFVRLKLVWLWIILTPKTKLKTWQPARTNHRTSKEQYPIYLVKPNPSLMSTIFRIGLFNKIELEV